MVQYYMLRMLVTFAHLGIPEAADDERPQAAEGRAIVPHPIDQRCAAHLAGRGLAGRRSDETGT